MSNKNLPQWRQELKSSQKKDLKFTGNRWIQIATINSNNEPRLRTVVFRGWLKENSMLIFTDSRSEKYRDIKLNDNVEILWLFAKSKSQFRFKGNAKIVNENTNYWDNLNERSKSSWFWPNPSNLYSELDYKKNQKDSSKPNNFIVYEIVIHTVELLKLEKPIHKRFIWKENNNWEKIRINP